MAGHRHDLIKRQAKRFTVVGAVALTLAGAASAQAASLATAPGATHAASAAFAQSGNQHGGGDSGHRVH